MSAIEGKHSEETLQLPWPQALGPWLLVIRRDEAQMLRELEVGQSIVLGSAERVDVCVNDRWVSGRHCRVEGLPEGILIEDLGSTNGILLGQGRVKQALVGAGGTFIVGRTLVNVERGAEADAHSAFTPLPGLTGTSPAMRRVVSEIRRCATLSAPVLVQGESGTGKDVVSRAIHALSGRRGALVPLNVGAIPESLADAELFGHRRGAFTGAVESRTGAFVQADGGTLFLDEVAELSFAGQVRLLRVIEDGHVRAVGAQKPVKVDVRLVSATWANLPDSVRSGEFRQDLYYRLSTFIISLPALRERRSDIPALVRALLERHAGEVGEKDVTPTALGRLMSHSWPGNVRELSSVLYRAAARADGHWIEARHLDFGARGQPRRATMLSAADALRLVERYDGNVSAAARAVSVPRSTLRSWLARDRARKMEDLSRAPK